MHLHFIPRVGDISITRQVIRRFLIETIPEVGILAVPEPAPGHVRGLVEVVPRQTAVRSFQTL